MVLHERYSVSDHWPLVQKFVRVYMKNIERSHYWSFVEGITVHRWIPRKKGQKFCKCFYAMTSSWCNDLWDIWNRYFLDDVKHIVHISYEAYIC